MYMAKKQYRNPARKLERITKGFANHWRIRILELLSAKAELSVEEIADELNANLKTIASHIQRLANAGLVEKRSAGRAVRHRLSKRGKNVLIFLRKLASEM